MLVTPIVASTFRSDGGAMFGLVPKAIWSRRMEADDQNRIRQNANALLVELDDGRKGIIDTGCGDPGCFSSKDRERNGLPDHWQLLESLAQVDTDPADLSFVILTHLHWDHAGGCSRPGQDDDRIHTFPNAQVFVHADEWNDATASDPLLHKSYPPDVLAALKRTYLDSVVLVTDLAPDILPGIRMARTSGHTRGHCAVVLRDDDLVIRHPAADQLGSVDALVFAADVCPTQHHLPLVFQTSFDTYPLQTRMWKRDWLPQIVDEEIALFFCHDPDLFGARIATDPRREYNVTKTLAVSP